MTAASTIHGHGLLGVIAIGSWARGQAAVDSDVDVLLVLDPTVPLTRDLLSNVGRRGAGATSTSAIWTSISPIRARGRCLAQRALVQAAVGLDRSGSIATAASRQPWRRRSPRHRTRRVVRAVVHGQPCWKEVA
ncbi:MAG: nucleotidyltransferase domain-containing protein [Vicinamibacterales bacterium]